MAAAPGYKKIPVPSTSPIDASGEGEGDILRNAMSERALPELSRWNAIRAQFESEKKETFLGSMGENGDLEKAQDEAIRSNSPVLSASDANALYPDLDVPFSGDVRADVAKYINEQHQENRLLQTRISMGPQDWIQSIGNFGAGFAAHATDPLEMGIGIGMGAMLGAGGLAARMGGGFIGKFGSQFTGNLLENMLSEGFVQSNRAALQREAGIGLGASNAIFGAAVGTTVGVGVPAAFKGAKKAVKFFNDRYRKLRGLPPDITEAMKEKMSSDFANDRVPDHEAMENYIREVEYKELPNDEFFKNSTYRPNAAPFLNTKGKLFYSASTGQDAPFGIKGSQLTGTMGGGMHQMTSNPVFALNKAVSVWDTGRGTVFKNAIKDDLVLLDLNAPLKNLPDNIRSKVKEALGTFSKIARDDDMDLGGLTLKETLEEVKDNIGGHRFEQLMEGFRGDVEKMGFDGVRELGVDGDVVSIFQKAKVLEAMDMKESGFKSFTSQFHPEHPAVKNFEKAMLDPKRKLFHNADDAKAIDEARTEPLPEPKIAEAKNKGVEIDEEIRQLSEKLSDADKKALEEINDKAKTADMMERVEAAAMECING